MLAASLLSALAVAAGIAYAFWPQPLPVDVAMIERGSIRVTVDGEGQARVREVYKISAPLAGRITRVALRAGDAVEANRTLITSLEETDPAFLDARSIDTGESCAGRYRRRKETAVEHL